MTRWLILACLLALGPTPARLAAQDLAPAQTAYVTGSPVADWLGLATPSGRDAIQLGDGCEGVAPGLNVMQDNATGADLRLRVVDPVVGVLPAECVVAARRHMSDVPCIQNQRGACDVAFAG